MSEAWDDEGFGGENDWGDESVASDLEEDELEDEPEDEGSAGWDDDLDDEQ